MRLYPLRPRPLPYTTLFRSFVDGTLTITQRPITVTASSPSKVYGDADPALTYTITSGNLVGDDTLSGSLTRDPGEDVGRSDVQQGALDTRKHGIRLVHGTFT